jgi:hypothetical protein
MTTRINGRLCEERSGIRAKENPGGGTDATSWSRNDAAAAFRVLMEALKIVREMRVCHALSAFQVPFPGIR